MMGVFNSCGNYIAGFCISWSRTYGIALHTCALKALLDSSKFKCSRFLGAEAADKMQCSQGCLTKHSTA